RQSNFIGHWVASFSMNGDKSSYKQMPSIVSPTERRPEIRLRPSSGVHTPDQVRLLDTENQVSD
ncbi:MAG TPA: hypothetical protein VMO76_11250, partial [Candidatus Udaeobacter sp.]|nr:hypothetical protein [Candidatus Udaeobacter sp.]